MNRRRNIPRQLIDKLLVKSKRRCPMCFLTGDTNPKVGNVAHLKSMSAGGTDTLDNLVYLCMQHHDELDRIDRGGISPHEVKVARNALYQAIENETLSLTTHRPKVFVIHGHNELAKHEVASFLTENDLEPIILSEQPSFGLTILEKIERNTDAKHVIAILTPDEPNGRPRQNVVFELGYFIGRLGSQRVCALVESGVHLPSDIRGVLYIEMDKHGRWKDAVKRELVVAGLPLSLPETDQKPKLRKDAQQRHARRRG